MNYSSLEDAFGTPFGQRAPITSSSAKDEPPIKKSDNKEKLAEVVKSVESSLPLDKDPSTESFSMQAPRRPLPEAPLDPRLPTFRQPSEGSFRDRIREHFAMSGGGGDDSKLDRILKLIEQNRTGYAPATTQDMLLYIATGVFFLFTFDTFVTLGKAMRGR